MPFFKMWGLMLLAHFQPTETLRRIIRTQQELLGMLPNLCPTIHHWERKLKSTVRLYYCILWIWLINKLAFENGKSNLLLLLSGTLPVQFRGETYRFPISLWVPQSYPREAPIVYVTPSQDMLIRPGQHVYNNGRIFHPYLAQWAKYWDVGVFSLMGYFFN